MNNITTSWGETLPFSIMAEDASTATLLVGGISLPLITKTSPFIDGVADVSIPADDMKIPTGEYKYQFVITYENGDVVKLPDSRCADCDLPTITVCPTIDMEVS